MTPSSESRSRFWHSSNCTAQRRRKLSRRIQGSHAESRKFLLRTMNIKDENPIGRFTFFVDEEGEVPLVESRANALIAFNAASKTIIGPTSSMRGRLAPSPDQQHWNAPLKQGCIPWFGSWAVPRSRVSAERGVSRVAIGIFERPGVGGHLWIFIDSRI